uniref:Uncharacterized protein n=1 Tax=Mustela putorius furo TaxID=9669 RepID=M3Y5U1_MUSPF
MLPPRGTSGSRGFPSCCCLCEVGQIHNPSQEQDWSSESSPRPCALLLFPHGGPSPCLRRKITPLPASKLQHSPLETGSGHSTEKSALSGRTREWQQV